MIYRSLGRALSASLLALALSSASAQSLPEKQTVVTLSPAGPTRAYLSDIAFHHIVDGRLHVVDVETARYLGQIPTAYAGQSVVSPDRKTIYVSTTYYPRLSRGTRADVIDIWDAGTLSHKGEIPIPERRAQAVNYKGLITVSSDSHWLYAQNATPASSISVVDLRKRRLASEVATSGCWLAIPVPSAPNRFATLCGDGTIETITLDERGALASRARSERFFDPDVDPIFVHAENIGDRFFFVSFLGKVYEVDLSAETARAMGNWPVVDATDAKKNWRPGGYQLLAVHEKSNRLFVLMHPDGEEGSHKYPAAEIWGFDLTTHKRIARIPGSNAIALSAIQGDKPRLVALDAMTMGLVLIDAGDKPHVVQRMDEIAETATLIEMQ